MHFDIPSIADWTQIGDYRQSQTDRSNIWENNIQVDYDYNVGDKILTKKMVSSAKQSPYEKTIDYLFIRDMSFQYSEYSCLQNIRLLQTLLKSSHVV